MTRSTSFDPCSAGLNVSSIGASRSAVQAVSEYAQGSITLVPALDDMPAWYAPVQAAITTSQAHSKTWLHTLCPAVTLGLPADIVGFSKTFKAESTKILTVLNKVGSGASTPAQKQAVANALTAILADTQKFADKAASVKAQIAAYTEHLVADVDALGEATATLEQHLTDGNQYVQKLKQVYSENFVTVEGNLSPCNVIVMVDMDISVKVTMTGAPMQAVAIVIAQTLVGAVDQNVKQAMPAVQVVMDSWGTLQAKIAAVLTDLDGVSTDIAGFLKQFDLQAAQDQWDALGIYANELLNP